MNADVKIQNEVLVSVIMPAYNCELYIETAIRSVMGQSHGKFELLVLDDGSTDATCAIAQRLSNEDERVRLIKNPHNMGVARTRNRGLDMAKGEFVAFLDSDDRWHPKKLSVGIEKMMRERADLAYSSYAIVDGEGKECRSAYTVPESVDFGQLLKENVIGCSTVILSQRVARKYRFATDFYHEDYCLWLDILRDGYRAVGCTEVLADWRLIENSRSFDKRRSAKNRWRIYRNYLHLSIPKSALLFVSYALGGIRKYYGK